jgi:hypothetical protein
MERRNQQSGSPKARQSFKADRGHLLSVLLLTVCVVLPASAADRGFYAGINVGSSMFDSDHTIVSGKIITTTVTRTWTDDSSLAWSADVGYQLNRYIGIEASYWDLGSAAYDQTRTYLIIVRAPRCRSDDREVGVAPNPGQNSSPSRSRTIMR